MKQNALITLPCLLVGGTEMHTLALARALSAYNHSVTVCVYYEHDPAMVQALEAIGARVQLLRLRRNSRARNINRMPALAAALARAIRQTRPDIVHVQYMAPGVLPILLARSLGVRRVITTVHVPAGPYGWRRRIPATLGTRVADALICVSRVAEKSFFGDFALFDPILLRRGRRHFTIPNCVDLAEVDRIAAGVQPSTLRHALGLNGHPIVAAVARLSAEKGISTLIRSMTQVIRQMPEARLLIIGDGPERAALETEARTNHIADQIRWVGRLPQTEVFKHLAIADIVAVPSRFEGFGLTAAEAMAFGKAVVASAVDGLKEVVTNESTGLLVDVDDVPDMSRCIVRLLANPGEREHMGHAGRARVERDYSFQAFADRWSSLYDVLS